MVPVNNAYMRMQHAVYNHNDDDSNNDGDIWLTEPFNNVVTVISIIHEVKIYYIYMWCTVYAQYILCTNNELLNVSIAQNKPFGWEFGIS